VLAPGEENGAVTISLADEDAAAAFGVVAVLAGHLYAEAVPPRLLRALRERLERCGLVDGLADEDRLGYACDRLAGRIRLAIEAARGEGRPTPS
jgi:hypothetical protein